MIRIIDKYNMAQISKYLISKDVYNRIFNLFIKNFVNLKTIEASSDFMEGFLTPTEKIMLAKRLAIGFMFAKGYGYREISQVLKVSLGTIGSVVRNYKYQLGYQAAIQKIMSDEDIEDFWLKVGETFSTMGTFGGKGSKSWLSIKNELRKKRLDKAF